jgi:hypothetical protein
MHSVAVAETLLSFLMPRERASATVGDLLEFPQGQFAFWRSVVSAAAGAAFRQLTFTTIIKAAVLYVVLSAVFDIPYTVLLIRTQPQGWLFWLSIYGMIPLSFVPGYLIARWLPNREVGGIISVFLLRAMLGLAFWFYTSEPLGQVILPRGILPMLLGTLFARWTRLRADEKRAALA